MCKPSRLREPREVKQDPSLYTSPLSQAVQKGPENRLCDTREHGLIYVTVQRPRHPRLLELRSLVKEQKPSRLHLGGVTTNLVSGIERHRKFELSQGDRELPVHQTARHSRQ